MTATSYQNSIRYEITSSMTLQASSHTVPTRFRLIADAQGTRTRLYECCTLFMLVFDLNARGPAGRGQLAAGGAGQGKAVAASSTGKKWSSAQVPQQLTTLGQNQPWTCRAASATGFLDDTWGIFAQQT